MNEMINSPALYEYIDRHRSNYVFLFIPYMFATTYWGSMTCPERSILIPCLHDEAYARMQLIREMCERVRGLLFNSWQEARLAQSLYKLDPERVVAVVATSSVRMDPRSDAVSAEVRDFRLFSLCGPNRQGKRSRSAYRFLLQVPGGDKPTRAVSLHRRRRLEYSASLSLENPEVGIRSSRRQT